MADPAMAEKYAALITWAESGEHRFIPALRDDAPLGPFAAARVCLDFRGEDQDTPYRELLRLLTGTDTPARPLPRTGPGAPKARRTRCCGSPGTR